MKQFQESPRQPKSSWERQTGKKLSLNDFAAEHEPASIYGTDLTPNDNDKGRKTDKIRRNLDSLRSQLEEKYSEERPTTM